MDNSTTEHYKKGLTTTNNPTQKSKTMFIVKPTTKKGQKLWGVYSTIVKKFYTKYEAKADAVQAAAVLNAKADADKNLQVLKWIDPNTDATGN